MKKIKNKKFDFEKFELAKLNNFSFINGGTGGPAGSSLICTTTNTNDPNSSEDCKNRPPQPQGPIKPNSTNGSC